MSKKKKKKLSKERYLKKKENIKRIKEKYNNIELNYSNFNPVRDNRPQCQPLGFGDSFLPLSFLTLAMARKMRK